VEDVRQVNAKMPMPSTSAQSRAELLKTIGVVVLVLGIGSASVVYWSGQNSSASQSHHQEPLNAQGGWSDSTLALGDTKGASRTIEMNFGKVAVLIVNWLHRWEQLKPHQLLAITIATISILTALSCFLVANRLLRVRI
jgi:hypothetical protein